MQPRPKFHESTFLGDTIQTNLSQESVEILESALTPKEREYTCFRDWEFTSIDAFELNKEQDFNVFSFMLHYRGKLNSQDSIDEIATLDVIIFDSVFSRCYCWDDPLDNNLLVNYLGHGLINIILVTTK